MNKKRNLVIGALVLLVLVILWSVLSGTKEVGEAINDTGDGAVMQQIEPPTAAFQAGTAPLGENEAETGYLHEDGKRYYGGKEVVEDNGVIQLDFPIEKEEDAVEVVDIRLRDENGNLLEPDPETEALLDNLYQDE